MELSRDVTYQVYVLRVWRERPASTEHPAVWRFSLEDTCTRQRHGFGSLEALVTFLREQVGREEGEKGIREKKEIRGKGNKAGVVGSGRTAGGGMRE